MNNRLLALGMTMILGFPASSLGAQNLLIEWSDHPSNQNWMVGDPVFQRTLFCTSKGRHDDCELAVITIGRIFCPAVLLAEVFRTADGSLNVSRRRHNAVDLEFTNLLTTWTIHLDLIGDDLPIVERASGVVVTKPLLPSDPLRSSELVALVEGHEGISTREFAEVDLKCSKIAVVAAKRDAK